MISVVDYPDVQAALNDVENGTSVYFPAREYMAPAGGWLDHPQSGALG